MKKIVVFSFLMFFLQTDYILATTQENFSYWLYDIGAYDLFIDNVSNKYEKLNTPSLFLSYIISLYNLKNYEQIEREVNQNKDLNNFPNNIQAKVYLILAKSLRARQKYLKAVRAYLKIWDLVKSKEAKDIFSKENLELLVENVCLDRWWKQDFFMKQDLKDLPKILDYANVIWPKNSVFQNLKKLNENKKNRLEIQNNSSISKDYNLFINYLLADYLSLDNLKLQFLNKIANQSIKEFIEDNFYRSKNTLFKEIFEKDINEFNKEKIDYSNNEKLKILLEELSSKDNQEGLVFIENQIKSIFLDEKMKSTLYKIYFCYLLLNSKLYQASKIYSNFILKDNSLKLDLISLKLGITDNKQINLSKYTNYSPYFIKYMLKGLNYPIFDFSYPWDKEFSSLEPLGFYQQIKEKKLSFEISYKFSFLFPSSYLGQKGFLSLAKKAYLEDKKELAWKYLQFIDSTKLDRQSRISLLEAKAGLLMELGQSNEALETYLQLLSIAPTKLKPEKKLKLGLLAQRLGKLSLAENIFINLLAIKENLNSALQAETLFWLAETYQLQNLEQKALENYLKVAFAYPKENIWAITALYRAGQIAEKRGNYILAKKLYTLVLKKADRKSQKEAASLRLKAIEEHISSTENEFLF